jgi:hypothetical protein
MTLSEYERQVLQEYEAELSHRQRPKAGQRSQEWIVRLAAAVACVFIVLVGSEMLAITIRVVLTSMTRLAILK